MATHRGAAFSCRVFTEWIDVLARPRSVLRLVIAMAAVASLICSAEWLSLRQHFGAGELYDWHILRLSFARGWKLGLARRLDQLFGYPRVLALPLMQAAASLLLLWPGAPDRSIAVGCVIVAVAFFLLTFRGVTGFNGGDAMAKVVVAVGSVAFTIGTECAFELALAFLAFQLVLAYFTPGVLRVSDKRWWNGEHVIRIMRLKTFGRRRLWEFLSASPRAAALLGGTLVVFEVTFPLAFFGPKSVTIAFLIAGTVFHVTNAVVMDLNVFPWSFVGSYPALLWASQWFRDRVYG